MPVRPEIVAKRAVPYPDFDGTSPINMLVLGGSQGAHVFSAVVPDAVAKLDPRWRDRLVLSQQCRPEDLSMVRRRYEALGVQADLAAFFSDRLAAAHVLIGRAGASTVAEATAVGRPAILVPYPHAVDDHQTANAEAVDEVGGGWLMPESALSATLLADRLNALFGNPSALKGAAACSRAAGRPDAAATFADLVCDVMRTNGDTDVAGKEAA
jgi:UDP-N-acetylglucosamine--N-acetylmuramyl-(pentapeptide) pyrophosphoryl-undecaprenol N-acetylglucosamine transferase